MKGGPYFAGTFSRTPCLVSAHAELVDWNQSVDSALGVDSTVGLSLVRHGLNSDTSIELHWQRIHIGRRHQQNWQCLAALPLGSSENNPRGIASRLSLGCDSFSTPKNIQLSFCVREQSTAMSRVSGPPP
jgi:hypothetical protein